MKSCPIVPAEVDFDHPDAPFAPAFGDLYHARAGAFAQAGHVFLGGNGLPARWQGQASFVILETGFGLGNNFLASWAAWRADPQRCERLTFISIEKHPLRRADLARAHAHSPAPAQAAELLAAWPPLTPDLHQLEFESGRVRLLLCLGDAADWLPELVARVDAIYLDGFAPKRNPQLWDARLLKGLARLARPGTTAATWSAAHAVRRGLAAAGFEVQAAPGFAGKAEMTLARFVPRHEMRGPAGRAPLAPAARTALIVGAGLAGAACARAFAAAGLHCTLLEQRPGIAQAGSGNAAGLFHGTLHADDGLHARFNRTAALHTERLVERLVAGGALPWRQRGLLRLETARNLAGMQALLARQALPADYVQALGAAQASALAGLRLAGPAWFYPGGGALAPAQYAQALLGEIPAARLDLRLGSGLARLERDGARWQAFDAQGGRLAAADLVVLAGGAEGLGLLRDTLPWQDWPLTRQRGQVTRIAAALAEPAGALPRLPLAGLGYGLRAPDGGLLCGASNETEDMEPTLRASEQHANLRQWAQLAGLDAAAGAALLAAQAEGRVGWRLLAPDRLPLLGGVLQPEPLPARCRIDQPRFLPRLPGLLLCTALASRGIGWAALAAEIAVSQALGLPCPVEASLLDAIDPTRFWVRARRGAGMADGAGQDRPRQEDAPP